MKLGSLRSGRDGALCVVSRDLERAVLVPDVAPTLQSALDEWERTAPRLAEVAERLEKSDVDGAFALDHATLAAPLPRAFQWADASAYLNHVALVRRARGAELPENLREEPLMYQGGSDGFLGPRDPIAVEDEAFGIDFEAELAVITDDVCMGATPADASTRIALLALVNDVSLRSLIPAELAKGFGFFHGKPASAFAPVAVTPDEVAEAWDGARLHLPVVVHRSGELFGRPDAGSGMSFDFPTLIAHAARTRPLCAGTIIGSGTVSNEDRARGSCCISEVRALEQIDHGEPRTPFLSFGETVRIEVLDAAGGSVFGPIDQPVVRYAPPA